MVLETAGSDWAAREVKGFASISNAYTIHDDWDSLLAQPARTAARPISPQTFGDEEKARCRRRGSGRRPPMTSSPAQAGKISVRTMADLLRHTGEEADYEPCRASARPASACMPARTNTASGRLPAP